MATARWDRLARENASTARGLGLGGDVLRSMVSRAYYAAYSRITFALLEAGAGPFGDRENPPHKNVPKLVLNRLSSLPMRDRKRMSQIVRRMRRRREIADYQPRVSVDGVFGRESLRDLGELELLFGGK